MEYAEKGDLNSVIKNKILNDYENIDEEVIWKWFTQIASAIKYIHGKKIIHRDIKLDNVFISRDNVLKLGDFGISKCLENSMDFAASGVGTPYYLSPEICLGLKYNFKSDIWMLGCLLYELCTFKKPFKSDSIKELIKNIINNHPELIDKNLYSEGLINTINLMLNKQPDERPDIEAIWLITQFCSKSASKIIDKNKLKIEVEDHDIAYNPTPLCLENKLTPVSSDNNDYKNPINENKIIDNIKNYQSKYTPSNYKIELNKIRKNLNLSPMNSTNLIEPKSKRRASGTTANSTPKNVITKSKKNESDKSINFCNAPTGNTGKNFKNRHYRHISINISSMQSPEHNAVYQIENIEKVENIEFPSPINTINKPTLTPTNIAKINKITPKEALAKKEAPLTTKVGKKPSGNPYKKCEETLNRRILIKNFLIQRYTKEKFDFMYNSIINNNNKIDRNKIKEIAGDDYKIAINYLGYLTSQK